MGKWFDGYDTRYELKQAKQHAKVKNLCVWKITYRNPITVAYYVGSFIPKRIQADCEKGRIKISAIDI